MDACVSKNNRDEMVSMFKIVRFGDSFCQIDLSYLQLTSKVYFALKYNIPSIVRYMNRVFWYEMNFCVPMIGRSKLKKNNKLSFLQSSRPMNQ